MEKKTDLKTLITVIRKGYMYISSCRSENLLRLTFPRVSK